MCVSVGYCLPFSLARSLSLSIFCNILLFFHIPNRIRNGTVNRTANYIHERIRAAFTIILHRLKSPNPFRVRNVAGSNCIRLVFCMCVITLVEWHGTRLSYICSFTCVHYTHRCMLYLIHMAGAPRNKTRLAYSTPFSLRSQSCVCEQANTDEQKHIS